MIFYYTRHSYYIIINNLNKYILINGFTNKIAKGIMKILPQTISLKLTKMILKKGINKDAIPENSIRPNMHPE